MPIQTLHLRSSQQGKEPTPGTSTGQLPVGSIAINFNSLEPFLSIQDSAGNVRRIAGVKIDASAPATPTGGELWIDTTVASKPVLKVYTGTAWIAPGGQSLGSGATAPTTPAAGDLWVDTSVAGSPVLKVYNGTAWVAVAPDATTSVKGLVQLATAAEVTAGVDAVKAVTPATAKVELDKKAPLNNAALTGVPTAPTAAAGTSTTQLATTAFVDVAVKAGISSGTTAPTNPVRGQIWIDTSVDPPVVKVWDDTPGPGAWVEAGGGASVEIAATAPATPKAGDMWWNSDDGRLYIYYTDADSSQWVDASPDSVIEEFWQRTGTTISPKTAGDSLDMGSFNVDGGAPADSVNIDSAGRLLVGTSTARDKFFNASNNATAFQVERVGSIGALGYQTASFIANSSDGVGSYVTMGASRGTAVNSYTALQFNDIVGKLAFQGADGTKLVSAAEITAAVDGTPGASNMPGRLAFSTTADGASSPTERMRISKAGEVKTSADWSTGGVADIMTWGRSGFGVAVALRYKDSSNSMEFFSPTGHTVTYTTTSDYRLKENLVPLQGASKRIQDIPVYQFNFNNRNSGLVDGFLAHEVQAVVPEAVSGTKDEVDADGKPVYQGIDQSKLVPLLTAALQEALVRIEQLETKVAALEGGAH